MMVWFAYKCVLLLVGLVHCAPEGYNYKKPDIAFELPSQVNPEPQLAGEIYQKSVSYSVSQENYGSNGNIGSNIVPTLELQNDIGAGVASLPLADVNNGVFVQNSASYNVQSGLPLENNPNGVIPPVLQLQAPFNPVSSNYYQNEAGITNGVSFNSQNGASNAGLSPSSPVNLQVASQIYQNTQQSTQSLTQQLADGQNGVQLNQITPVVTKHIYFHVPPPDVEQTFNTPLPQPKKTYKILFIKLPQQSSRNSFQLQSQGIIPVAPIEEKTLIYVLVKKPEESQVIVPSTPKLSEHEVLFVKYSENSKPSAGEIAKVIDVPKRNPQINVQILQPGFVNGKW